MTILAQLWLQEHKPTSFDFWLEDKLRLPETVKDIVGVHRVAERVVFSDTISDVLADMLDAGQIDIKTILTTTRMPAAAIWVEWPEGALRVGALFDCAPNGRIAVIVVAGGERQTPGIIFAGTLDALPMEAQSPAIHLGYVAPKISAEYFECALVEALCGLFFLEQPRLISSEPVSWGAKLQRAREKRGTIPLLEYRRITIKIWAEKKAGHGGAAIALGSTVAGGRRPYHQVTGHFRVIRRETPDVRAIWIDPFFRGDPAVGVLLRERTLA